MDSQRSPLSEREKEVAGLLLQGKSNKQIALDLGISNRTVEFHLRNIYTKLGVNSRIEAALKLAESRLWETTGDFAGTSPVQSTVVEKGASTENDANVISRRNPMKRLVYGAATLLITALVAALVILNFPTQTVNAEPTFSAPASTMIVEEPTATALVPTQMAEPERVVIPPHTVNGYTAAIESYYIDISHVIFQVRITGKEFDASRLGYVDLYDEYGNLVNSSGGIGPAVDPDLFQFSFVPSTLLKGDRFKGQFAFNLYDAAPNYETILAKFRFDFDLPIYPEVRFYPKQTVTANGLEILVDRVTVTPVFTQVYLCFQPPSNEPWTIGNETVLQIAGKETPLYNSSELFSSFTGSYWGIHSEPYWVPPVKNGSCYKIGFQTGTSHPESLKLTIPDLENMIAYLKDPNPLAQLDTLYPGLSKRQAYHTYLEENGYTYKGPWVFEIDLVP